MTIGIDVREAAGRPAGKGRYVFEIVSHLAKHHSPHHFRLYTKDIPDLGKLPNNFSWRVVRERGLGWHRQVAKLANRECDLYFATTSYLTCQFLRIPYVLVVYDLVSFKDFATPQPKAKLIERYALRRAAKRAKRILTISKATADDLASMYPDVQTKIAVTPLAADARFRAGYSSKEQGGVKKKYRLPEEFILCTGTIEPRKNLTRLIKAYQALPKRGREGRPLVLVGQQGWQSKEVFSLIEDDPDIHYLDFVSDQDLGKLYAAALVFCYPSLYEGFGLPVLEAMQSGTPVITSNVSSLPEVGGEAVCYVDPHRESAITQALLSLLRSPAKRKSLRAKGLTRAKSFSWDKTVALTSQAFDEA